MIDNCQSSDVIIVEQHVLRNLVQLSLNLLALNHEMFSWPHRMPQHVKIAGILFVTKSIFPDVK